MDAARVAGVAPAILIAALADLVIETARRDSEHESAHLENLALVLSAVAGGKRGSRPVAELQRLKFVAATD